MSQNAPCLSQPFDVPSPNICGFWICSRVSPSLQALCVPYLHLWVLTIVTFCPYPVPCDCSTCPFILFTYFLPHLILLLHLLNISCSDLLHPHTVLHFLPINVIGINFFLTWAECELEDELDFAVEQAAYTPGKTTVIGWERRGKSSMSHITVELDWLVLNFRQYLQYCTVLTVDLL